MKFLLSEFKRTKDRLCNERQKTGVALNREQHQQPQVIVIRILCYFSFIDFISNKIIWRMSWGVKIYIPLRIERFFRIKALLYERKLFL